MTPRRSVCPFVGWERAILRTAHHLDTCPASDDHVRFEPSYLAVVLVVGSYADHDTGRNAHPGYARVRNTLGCHTNTVRRALAWAVSHGWLVARGDVAYRGTSRVFDLNVPPRPHRVGGDPK